MKKRKHRVVVEITFDKPLTAKQAAYNVSCLVGWNLQYGMVSHGERLVSVTKFTCKQFNRVVQGLINNIVRHGGIYRVTSGDTTRIPKSAISEIFSLILKV